MKIKTLLATLLTLTFFTAGYAQTLDKAKLDQLFDRLAEKNKAMGSLVIAKGGKKATVTRDGSTLFFQPPGASSAVPLEATAEDKFQIEGAAVFTFDAAKNQMTVKRRGGERVFTKEK